MTQPRIVDVRTYPQIVDIMVLIKFSVRIDVPFAPRRCIFVLPTSIQVSMACVAYSSMIDVKPQSALGLELNLERFGTSYTGYVHQ